MGIFNRRKSGSEVQGAQVSANSAGPEIKDSFTDLAAAIVASPNAQTMNAFWKAVYDLDEWHFLPSAPPGEHIEDLVRAGRTVDPVTLEVDGKWHVVVFTSEHRAAAAAKANDMPRVGDGYGVLSIRRDDAASFACSLHNEAIEGVIFNHNRGEHGMTAPLNNIAAMYDHILDRLPAPMFERFVRAATAANSDKVWERLNHHLVRLEHVFFVGDAGPPHSPQLGVAEGKGVALLFTDKERAMYGAKASGANFPGGKVSLIAMTPAEAAKYLEDLQRVSSEKGHPITNVVINRGSSGYMTEIADLRRHIEMQRSASR